jgi:peptidoglycan/xylan/chitin deacetylase (PgdA/CDA1 family)
MMPYADRLTDDGSLTLFLFHGVIEEDRHRVRNYTRKHLLAADFRAIVEALGRSGQALSMDQVLEYCLAGRAFPPRAFAVTFDDGFENNLSVARPVLDHLGIPATVYVTTRFIDENGMSWIDRIEWALERTPGGTLRFPWLPMPVAFDGAESKIAVLTNIRQAVKHDPFVNVDALVADIFSQLELDEVTRSDDPLDRKMDWRQVRAWSAPGFIVGGHSHTHPILSFLTPSQLDGELDTSLTLLKQMAGLAVTHYSYPEGLAHCFSPQVIAALKARGIACCPTAIDGVNPPGTDPFRLKRVMVT